MRRTRLPRFLLPALLMLLPAGSGPALPAKPGESARPEAGDFLPGPSQAKVLEVSPSGPVRARVVVLTTAYVTKESGPPAALAKFGEVYGFSPSYFAVRRDEPTTISFWNLQGDDTHDFMLLDPQDTVLMKLTLPPLSRVDDVYTFHQEGLFPFYCTLHQPDMSGQILVLPPRAPAAH